MHRKLAALIGLTLLLAVSSCSGCYYGRVGWGQAKVLMGRQPIEEALASSDLSAEEKARLAEVPVVRAFAHETIGLARNGSYTTFYDTGEKPISWNVTACDKASFRAHTWSFPFVGTATYKGFFSKDQADEEAERLRDEGYDVVVREVTAYSTLGWFDDPVFRRMLRYGEHDLANTLIHELTHASCFKEGDQSFNESVATFMGNEGALAFLRSKYGPDSAEERAARDAKADEAAFSEFIEGLYGKLDRLYRGPGTRDEKVERREAIFAAAKVEFESFRKARMRGKNAYAWFAKRELNNALLVGYRHYHTDLDVFGDVHALSGGDFKKSLDIFREAARRDAPRAYLAEWRTLALKKGLTPKDESATVDAPASAEEKAAEPAPAPAPAAVPAIPSVPAAPPTVG